ncbi:tyrosine-type recombinase/integrase [Oceanobacillus senegalensis]|uniref:tyrosine-type recombinase/integrase n=1 Tax=Oceanobacillus senegalensis TaxID=1936063 RepID=UPI002481A191|nr:tyrosine-type recombinase/integrase [Oceanobacillus senegalensis]
MRSLTPHTLRHGFAILSVEHKMDVYRIMQTLGHEIIETTPIYLENKQSKETNAAHDWKNNTHLNMRPGQKCLYQCEIRTWSCI